MFENVLFTPNLLLKYCCSSKFKDFPLHPRLHSYTDIIQLFSVQRRFWNRTRFLIFTQAMSRSCNSITKTSLNFWKPCPQSDWAIWSNVRTCWAGPTGFSTWQQKMFSVWPTREQAHINPSLSLSQHLHRCLWNPEPNDPNTLIHHIFFFFLDFNVIDKSISY